MIRLFHSPSSPYVRKVLVSAIELGLQDQIQILPANAGPINRDAEIVKHNSSGKIPCALLPDETPLFDSRVICAYLDSLSSTGKHIYPRGARRFEVLTLEALGDSIMDASLLCRFEVALRPQHLRWDAWFDGQMAKVDSGLKDLELRWFEKFTDGFHADAIAIACALGYIDFRFPEKDWRDGCPKLAAWFAEVSGRRSMADTMPLG